MQIHFSPMRCDEALEASINGDTLTLNGEAFDFTPVPEGATLPRAAVACDWLASDVVRTGGEIRLTLILPHGPDAPPETLFPAPITATGGPVALPASSNPPAEDPAP